MASLRTNLVKIGNSQGVRIPKALLRQVRLVDEIEIEVQEDCLVLKPAHHPRAGWDELFEKKKGGASDPELEAWEKMTDADGDEDWAWK